MNYQVTYRGFVGGPTGYDKATRQYILALDKLGVDVRIEPLSYREETFFAGVVDNAQATRIKELIDKPYAENKKKVLICHIQPFSYDPVEERKKYDIVIFNTVWETTRVPENWIVNSNKADAIFVPSTQNVEALRDSGITSPIYMVPHGAEADKFNPDNKRLILRDTEEKFTFLSVFQWQHRKAPEALLEAYWKEFTSKDDVALIVKTFWGHQVNRQEQQYILNQISGFKNKLGITDSAPVYVTTSLFSEEDLKGLYRTANAFVLPSRGEGVGLPYIEALCNELPVIATNWGGSTDFLNSSNSYPVDYTLKPTTEKIQSGIAPNFNQLFTAEMEWAEPNVDSLRFQMRSVYETPLLAKRRGLKGRQDMLEMTWDKSGEQMKKAIEEVISKCKQ